MKELNRPQPLPHSIISEQEDIIEEPQLPHVDKRWKVSPILPESAESMNSDELRDHQAKVRERHNVVINQARHNKQKRQIAEMQRKVKGVNRLLKLRTKVSVSIPRCLRRDVATKLGVKRVPGVIIGIRYTQFRKYTIRTNFGVLSGESVHSVFYAQLRDVSTSGLVLV